MNIKPIVLGLLGLLLALFPLYVLLATVVYIVTGHAWIPNDDGLSTRPVLAMSLSALMTVAAAFCFSQAVEK